MDCAARETKQFEVTEQILQRIPSHACQAASIQGDREEEIDKLSEKQPLFENNSTNNEQLGAEELTKTESYLKEDHLTRTEPLIGDKFADIAQLIVQPNEKQDHQKTAEQKLQEMPIETDVERDSLMYPNLEVPSAPPISLEDVQSTIPLQLPEIRDRHMIPIDLSSKSSKEINTINTDLDEYRLILNDDQLLQNNKLQCFSTEKLREYYNCNELEMVNDFQEQFLEKHSPPELESSLVPSLPPNDFKRDFLFHLLSMYHSCQINIQLNLKSIELCQKEAFEVQSKIWVKKSVKETFSARCGDNINLKETVSFE